MSKKKEVTDEQTLAEVLAEQPAPKAKPIARYVYQGAGAYLQGLPMRDIGAAEWGDRPAALTERALALGLYRPEE